VVKDYRIKFLCISWFEFTEISVYFYLEVQCNLSLNHSKFFFVYLVHVFRVKSDRRQP